MPGDRQLLVLWGPHFPNRKGGSFFPKASKHRLDELGFLKKRTRKCLILYLAAKDWAFVTFQGAKTSPKPEPWPS